MLTKTFWRAAGERAAKTAAQVTLTLFVVNGTVIGWDEINWPASGWIVLVSTVASVLTSIVSAAATDGSPSLASEHLDEVEK